MAVIYLLLGGNRGNVRKTFSEVCLELKKRGFLLVRKSRIYTSPSWGFEDPELFYNQVLEITTNRNPEEMLETIISIEQAMGRVRDSLSWNYISRNIDIDILLYGDQIISLPNLVIPHPRLHLRRFALVPLCELIPDKIHPVFNYTFKHILAECSDLSVVTEADEI